MADGTAPMKINKTIAGLLLAAAALAASALSFAQGEGAAKPAASTDRFAPLTNEVAPSTPGLGTRYSPRGADSCLYCHDEEADTLTFTTAGIFKGPHGRRTDKHGPFGPGQLQCEACHGPGHLHSIKDSKKTVNINSFKHSSFLSVAERNKFCLDCHQGLARNAWHAGAHDRHQVSCSDCHKVHVARDPILAKSTEPEVCARCHKQQRADMHKPSAHPVRFGQMACSDCHNPHGSNSPAMLVKPTLNQTCTSCHAEKRGPLLWEHAPVAEDCSLCHASHGSVRQALLNKPLPVLCQQCHTVAGHPAVARTAGALPGGGAGGGIFLLAGSCTNCHSQVHGSNHPSGVKLMR
jgi:DmsE family decaheme c-type cytochrome